LLGSLESGTAAMKKTALTLTLILPLLFSMVMVVRSMQVDYSQFEGLPYDPPMVTLASPSQNTTYNVPDVPLNVTIQIRGFIYHNIERMRWLNYSLDWQAPVPMTLIVPSDLTPPYYVHGNEVLACLSDGSHNLTIFGETFVSGLNGYFNETVSFTVDTSDTPTTAPFPASLLFVASVGIAIVAIGLFVYFKKRKH
jgi:hypothetical protein